MYRSFKTILNDLEKTFTSPKRAVVAGADDAHVLEAVFAAQDLGLVMPVLVGVPERVRTVLEEHNYLDRAYKLVPAVANENPSEVAVKLIREGNGDFIIKGKLETRDLLKPILNKETGLNRNGFITHFGYMQLKNYHKMLAISDCAVIPYPDFDDKVRIIKAGVDALHRLGYEKPVIGALCAVEIASSKMPETEDAARLQKMAEAGAFGDAIVLGPVSYDLATRKEAAEIKGYDSPYAGNVDMLLVPQMVTGNVMSKIWNADAGNIMAGCLIGADVPIVLTSRSAGMEEKLNSILLCTILS